MEEIEGEGKRSELREERKLSKDWSSRVRVEEEDDGVWGKICIRFTYDFYILHLISILLFTPSMEL